jgi:site-specific DNA-methyltransferase (adenine-specific)
MMLRLMCGDCLKMMRRIEDGSVDLILCDLPYGITQNKWDSVIPLPELWQEYRRVLRPFGAVVLTASQPFTSALVTSNLKWFRHEWIWLKNRGSNFVSTGREPFKEHESVLVFSEGKWTYNKQMQPRTGGGLALIGTTKTSRSVASTNYNFSKLAPIHKELAELRVPSSWQKFNTDTSRLHPTIKPVPLMEYMVKTYSNEGDTVLDNCMGSGTTGVACKRLGRNFIGIEKDAEYFEIAKKRIHETKKVK